MLWLTNISIWATVRARKKTENSSRDALPRIADTTLTAIMGSVVTRKAHETASNMSVKRAPVSDDEVSADVVIDVVIRAAGRERGMGITSGSLRARRSRCERMTQRIIKPFKMEMATNGARE